MSDRLDHIAREPLPWRDEHLTECGREITATLPAVTPDEVRDRIRKWGKQRTSFTVCMTCVNRYDIAALHGDTWERNPIGLLHRELQRCGVYGGGTETPKTALMTAELHAISALIAAHREEFDAYVNGVTDTVSLADRRKKRARRA